MPRGTKSGSITKKRVTRYVNGRRKLVDIWEVRKRFDSPIAVNYRRVAYSADQATKTMRAIENDFADRISKLQTPDPELRTFSDLSKHFETNYLKPPVWHDGRKVEGMRSYIKRRNTLKQLRAVFDDQLLRDIGWAELAKFKSDRLRKPVVIKHRRPGPGIAEYDLISRTRSMASVQEPLKLARRMFNVAVRLGWLSENPFTRGDSLIVVSHERKRMRILSRIEEGKLLSFCNGRRGYLADAIVCAIDTAARQNEMVTLAVDDVYLEKRFMRIRTRNAKIEEERVVPITARLAPVLERLIEQAAAGTHASGVLLFPPGTATRIKRTFQPLCRLAGIEDFRWHDLRHTGTMRMLDAIKDPAKVMKITGHRQWSTFMVYVNVDEEIAREIAGALDAARGADTIIEANDERVN